jgi:hypothetical protein
MLYFEKITAEKAPNNSNRMQFYPDNAIIPYQYPCDFSTGIAEVIKT